MLFDFGKDCYLLMSYSTGLKYIVQRANIVAKKSGNVGVKIESSADIGSGWTDDAIGSDGLIHIGIKQANVIFPFSLRKMPDRMFVAGLVSVYHEGRHAFLHDLYQRDIVKPEMVYSHLAKQGNFSYYFCNGNRHKYTTEIDAEYHGVMSAYSDIDSIVKENKSCKSADDLICDYVNYQCEEMSYYIKHPDGKPFTSISEIDDAFQKAYEKATSHEPVKRDLAGRAVSDGAYREFRTSWHGDDAVEFVTLQNGRIRSEKQYMVDQIWDASNYDKDRMIAAITLHMHPEYGQFYYGLDTDGLSLDHVFKQSEDDAGLVHDLESEF